MPQGSLKKRFHSEDLGTGTAISYTNIYVKYQTRIRNITDWKLDAENKLLTK